jgi:transcriptional regulator with XRE-family HTH domain
MHIMENIMTKAKNRQDRQQQAMKWKKLRTETLDGMTQEDFGKLLAVKQSTVNRWENQEIGSSKEETDRKLEILFYETSDPEKLANLLRAIREEGPEAVSHILSCAARGSESMGPTAFKAAVAGGIIGGTVGVFGSALLMAGGAYATYRLLKKVFDPDTIEDES